MAIRLGNPLQAGGLSSGGIHAGLSNPYTPSSTTQTVDTSFAGDITFMAGTAQPLLAYLYD